MMSRFTLQDFLLLKDARNSHFEQIEKKKLTGVSIDSRTVLEGNVFFAIKGERFDGHDFLEDAVRKGATVIVVDTTWRSPEGPQWDEIAIVRVSDTTKALGELAALHRRKFKIPVVAITGTNGKTTTKEMTAGVLSRKMKIVKSQGNFNNQFGLPLTLFQISGATETAVVELGASFPGEIKNLCSLAQPTHGVITNIGKGHMEFFKSIEEVARTKIALIDTLPADGTGIVNGDDEFLKHVKAQFDKVITFGFNKGVDIRGESPAIRADGCFAFTVNGRYRISLNVPGRNNMYNALSAAAVGSLLKIDESEIIDSLQSYRGYPQRSEVTEWRGVTVINDSYNANPDSMKTALELLVEFPHKPGCSRIAVLGDMLELGEISRTEHEIAGQIAAGLGIETLITVGNEAQFISSAAQHAGHTNIGHCANHEDAAQLVLNELKQGDILLVKGSRGSRMELVLEKLNDLNSTA
jgi:UDP-N-acetylmuramoyl-tripeptide--D-alanyl-D-alanine ligase